MSVGKIPQPAQKSSKPARELSKGTSSLKTLDASKTPVRPTPKRDQTPEDKAFGDLMKKYNYDVTKIPGWQGGGGTQ
jgi:hypothetical protein